MKRFSIAILALGAAISCHRGPVPNEEHPADPSKRMGQNPASESNPRGGARSWAEFVRSGGRLPESPSARADLLASLPEGGSGDVLGLSVILNQGKWAKDERIYAAKGLALIGTEAALQSLFEAILAEQDPAIRKQLLGALDMLANPDGVEALASVSTQTTDTMVLAAVQDALARLASPETIQYLVELYRQTEPDSPQAAAVAGVLAGMKNPPCIAPMAAMLGDSSLPMPLFSATALALAKAPDRTAARALVNAYEGSLDAARKDEVLRVIGAIREAAALEVLVDVAGESKDERLKAAANEALTEAARLTAPLQ